MEVEGPGFGVSSEELVLGVRCQALVVQVCTGLWARQAAQVFLKLRCLKGILEDKPPSTPTPERMTSAAPCKPPGPICPWRPENTVEGLGFRGKPGCCQGT